MERTRKEIEGPADVRLFVNTFYYRASKDSLLAPLLGPTLKTPHRLEPLYEFWEGILLKDEVFHHLPFPKQPELALTRQHFDRWLSLLHETISELFVGARAEQAKHKAIRMSEIFRQRMELSPF